MKVPSKPGRLSPPAAKPACTAPPVYRPAANPVQPRANSKAKAVAPIIQRVETRPAPRPYKPQGNAPILRQGQAVSWINRVDHKPINHVSPKPPLPGNAPFPRSFMPSMQTKNIGRNTLITPIRSVFQPVLQRKSAPFSSRPIPNMGVIQAKWIKHPEDDVWMWNNMIDGVTWFMNSQGQYWFDVTDPTGVKKGNVEDYQYYRGQLHTREEWAGLGSQLPEDAVAEAMTELSAKGKFGSARNPQGYIWGGGLNPGRFKVAAEKSKPFYGWLYGDKPEPHQMNCWEAVLFSAFKAGIINKEYIKKAIELGPGGANQFVTSILAAPGVTRVTKPADGHIDLSGYDIPKGYVVLFGDMGEHVALSTGTKEPIQTQMVKKATGKEIGHGILELDKATAGITKSTIEDNFNNPAYAAKVSWGPFPDL